VEEYDADPCAKNSSQMTPFGVACDGGSVNVIRYLLEAPRTCAAITVSYEDMSGACTKPAALRYLVEESPQRSKLPLDGGVGPLTLFELACEAGALDSVKLLGALPGLLLERPTEARTALERAIAGGHGAVVRYLVEELADRVDIGRRSGLAAETPFHLACRSGSLDLVKYVVSSELFLPEDMTAIVEDVAHGINALLLALSSGSVHLVRWLVETADMHPFIVTAAPKRSQDITRLACGRRGSMELFRSIADLVVDGTPHSKLCAASWALETAAFNGHKDIVEAAFSNEGLFGIGPVDLNVLFAGTVLRNSISSGNVRTAQFVRAKLEDAGYGETAIQPDPRNCETPLHVACCLPNVAMVQWLMSRPSTACAINLPDSDLFTPFLTAASHGMFQIVKYFIESPELEDAFDRNATSMTGATAFCHACHRGDIRLAKYLASVPDIDVSIPARDATPFLLAATGGHQAVVEYIAEELADRIDLSQCTSAYNTAIGSAAHGGFLPVVKYLLGIPDVRGLVNLHNNTGTTALMFAVQEGHLDVVRLLCEELGEELEVDARNHHGDTPLLIASFCGQSDVVKYLISTPHIRRRISLNHVNSDGLSAFLAACHTTSLETVKALAEEASIRDTLRLDIVSTSGVSPFTAAVQKGSTNIVRYLTSPALAGRVSLVPGVNPMMYETAYFRHFGVGDFMLARENSLPGCSALRLVMEEVHGAASVLRIVGRGQTGQRPRYIGSPFSACDVSMMLLMLAHVTERSPCFVDSLGELVNDVAIDDNGRRLLKEAERIGGPLTVLRTLRESWHVDRWPASEPGFEELMELPHFIALRQVPVLIAEYFDARQRAREVAVARGRGVLRETFVRLPRHAFAEVLKQLGGSGNGHT